MGGSSSTPTPQVQDFKPVKRVQDDKCVIIVGLNESGKTSIINYWSGNEGLKTAPTQQVKPTTVKIRNMNLKIYDFGGGRGSRVAWQDYATQELKAVVYVVDQSEPEKFDEAQRELRNILLAVRRLENKIPVLIIANKSDKVNTPVQEVRETIKNRILPVEMLDGRRCTIVSVSAKTGENMCTALTELVELTLPEYK